MAKRINNEFYEDLGIDWYLSTSHPIALLRAENAARAPWIIEIISKNFSETQKILDIGCGGGFLTNPLAACGHRVTGIDLSLSSLQAAQAQDTTGTVHYLRADAYALPFKNESFDVVTALDLLEHVEDPEKVILEASRVLRKNGLFFFHTFNRNWISYLVVIKGIEWVLSTTPERMHVYELFIKPKELQNMCKNAQIMPLELRGLQPKLFTKALWRMLLTRRVPKDFCFKFSPSLLTGYIGYGKKL